MKTGFLTRNITATATLASAVIMLTAAFLMATPPAFAATGDLVAALTFSQNCSRGVGMGITFDGTNLWVSCFFTGAGGPDLLRVDPATGTVTYSTNVAGGLGSLAYDSSRNVIWAGEGVSGFTGSVVKIPLTGSPKTVAGPFIPGFPVPQAQAAAMLPSSRQIDDGLAIDLADPAFPLGVLYVSYDTSQSIFKYNADTGAFIGSFAEAPGIPANCASSGAFNSGVAIGGQLLYEGSDGCSHVYVVDKTTLVPQFDFTTVVAADPNFRDESLTCDTNTFFASLGKHVMWSKEAFSPNRAHAYEIPLNTCGSGGVVANPQTCDPAADATLVNEVFVSPTLTFDVSSPTRVLSSIVLTASTNIASSTMPTIAADGHSATGGSFTKSDPTMRARFTLQVSFTNPAFACTIDPKIKKGHHKPHKETERFLNNEQ